MIVFIEQYQYKVKDLEPSLRDLRLHSDDKIVFDEVGYYLNAKIHDCIFILPKVILWVEKDVDGKPIRDPVTGEYREKVLGKYTPEQFIHPERLKLSDDEVRFIYGFSTWIYRALLVYKTANPDNGIVLSRQTQKTGHVGKRRKSETLLDVLLSIQDFAKENRDFFFFVVKNRHCGLNKINWTRTISKTAAVIDPAGPVYLRPINKKRQINFDEELLVIFFSILNYMRERYGFTVTVDLGYELITGSRFEAYVEKGLGKRRLLKIKYKYFSDKALRLWDLCYAFFESEHRIYLNGDHEEYLLVKKFDRVFEAMIDELIGERKDSMPKALTKQDDGKLVDHMYRWQELMENQAAKEVFYIGDSKYYKRGTPLGKESIAKQFTYARNVIQWHLNLFLDDPDEDIAADRAKYKDGLEIQPIRDDVTEGYNVTPNFFISAMMSGNLKGGFKDDQVRPTVHGKQQAYIQKQFENRLFDRDTLIVAHYDVNFLFVLSLYAQDKTYRKAAWKKKVRNQFRKEIQELLASNFEFYAMTPKKKGIEKEFLHSDFQRALGKVYKPYASGADNRDYYSLALEKTADGSIKDEEVRNWLEQSFLVEKCALGVNPEVALKAKMDDYDDHPASILPNSIASGLLLINEQPAGFIDAVRNAPMRCPWILPDGKLKENVRVILLGYSQHVTMMQVKANSLIKGPFDVEGVRAECPSFKTVNLAASDKYFIWEVEI